MFALLCCAAPRQKENSKDAFSASNSKSAPSPSATTNSSDKENAEAKTNDGKYNGTVSNGHSALPKAQSVHVKALPHVPAATASLSSSGSLHLTSSANSVPSPRRFVLTEPLTEEQIAGSLSSRWKRRASMQQLQPSPLRAASGLGSAQATPRQGPGLVQMTQLNLSALQDSLRPTEQVRGRDEAHVFSL